MQTAIPFITYTEEKGFEISSDSIIYLKSLFSTKLAVVSIVGNYRTGKSFFINRVLLDKSDGSGFQVGPTINPCTKGLWLWNELLPHNNPNLDPDTKVLIIDAEGFGGPDRDLNHNSKIGLLSLLISSVFIYNSLGLIDENTINNLNLIVNLGLDVVEREPSHSFPSFLWLLRDFTLKMTDSEGKIISNNDYLERALDENMVKSNEEKIKTRKSLKKIFKERECCTLVRPVSNENDLQKLNSLKKNEFRKEFVEQAENIRKKIFMNVKPKTIKGKIMNGGIFLELCQKFIEIINKGGVPEIGSTWDYLKEERYYKIFRECENIVDKKINDIKIDETNNHLNIQSIKNNIKEEVLLYFKKEFQFYVEKKEKKEFKIRFEKMIEEKMFELKIKIDELNNKLDEKLIESKYYEFLIEQEEFGLPEFLSEKYLKKFNEFLETIKNLKFEQSNKLIIQIFTYIFEKMKVKVNFHDQMSHQEQLLLNSEIIQLKKNNSIAKEEFAQKIMTLESNTKNLILKNQELEKTVVNNLQQQKEELKKIILSKENKEKENEIYKTENIKLKNQLVGLENFFNNETTNRINLMKKTLILEHDRKILQIMEEKNDLTNKYNKLISTKKSQEKELLDKKQELNLLKQQSISIQSKKELTPKRLITETECDLIEITNRALNKTVEKMEEQCTYYKSKIEKLKEIKSLFKSCSQMQCSKCLLFMNKDLFQAHIQNNCFISDNNSLNFSNIGNNFKRSIAAPTNYSIITENKIGSEEILSPIHDNFRSAKNQNSRDVTTVPQNRLKKISNKYEKKENLDDLIKLLNRNDKYTVLQARKKDLMNSQSQDMNIMKSKDFSHIQRDKKNRLDFFNSEKPSVLSSRNILKTTNN